ncbi:hypothetical protein AAMO2058_001177000 [Amorphochlora amoebiformis]
MGRKIGWVKKGGRIRKGGDESESRYDILDLSPPSPQRSQTITIYIYIYIYIYSYKYKYIYIYKTISPSLDMIYSTSHHLRPKDLKLSQTKLMPPRVLDGVREHTPVLSVH